VINTVEVGRGAERFAADQIASVGAAVYDDMERPIGRTGQDDRRVADEGGFEVPGLGHLGFQADVMPGTPPEDSLLLERIEFRVGVDPVRGTPVALAGPCPMSDGG